MESYLIMKEKNELISVYKLLDEICFFSLSNSNSENNFIDIKNSLSNYVKQDSLFSKVCKKFGMGYIKDEKGNVLLLKNGDKVRETGHVAFSYLEELYSLLIKDSDNYAKRFEDDLSLSIYYNLIIQIEEALNKMINANLYTSSLDKGFIEYAKFSLSYYNFKLYSKLFDKFFHHYSLYFKFLDEVCSNYSSLSLIERSEIKNYNVFNDSLVLHNLKYYNCYLSLLTRVSLNRLDSSKIEIFDNTITECQKFVTSYTINPKSKASIEQINAYQVRLKNLINENQVVYEKLANKVLSLLNKEDCYKNN